MPEDACGSCFILFGLGQSCSVVTVSVRLLALDGMSYNGRSCLKVCLNLLTSFRQVVLTISDFGLNADRYSPDRDRTLDSAT